MTVLMGKLKYYLHRFQLNPTVAKAGGIQSQGAKGAAVVIYCKPLATPEPDSSGFPARVKT